MNEMRLADERGHDVTVEVALALMVIGLSILCIAVYAEMKDAEEEAEAWRQRFFGIQPEDPDSPISEDDFWGTG